MVPTWLGVIIISWLMAAALSSCASFQQLIGSSITRDIMEQSRNKTYSDKQLLRASGNSMIVVSFVILLNGLWLPPSIMWISYFVATLFAASWGPVAFARVYLKKVTKTSAFWSIILGFLGVILGERLKKVGVTLPVYFNPLIIGVILSSLALYIGSKFGEITVEERDFQENILQRIIEENEKEEIAITRRYPMYLAVSGIIIIAITFIFYYLPLTLAMK